MPSLQTPALWMSISSLRASARMLAAPAKMPPLASTVTPASFICANSAEKLEVPFLKRNAGPIFAPSSFDARSKPCSTSLPKLSSCRMMPQAPSFGVGVVGAEGEDGRPHGIVDERGGRLGHHCRKIVVCDERYHHRQQSSDRKSTRLHSSHDQISYA